MKRVREQAGRQRQKSALPSAAGPHRQSQTAGDLSFLLSSQDISQVRFSSHRKMVGNIIVFAKRALQQLLAPIFQRQSSYNAANARLMAYLCDRVARMEQGHATAALEAIQAEEAVFLDAVRETITGQLETLAQQQAEALQALQDEVASQNRQRRAQEQYLMRSLDELRQPLSESLSQQASQAPAKREMYTEDAFFVAFDEQFRGSRADIKERLRVYLPICKEAKIGTEERPVADLGCGRGEWLEVLQEEGMRAMGVDRNRRLVETCRQYGLDVLEGDFLTYLRGLPSNSLGGVTGFHIVEHLPFDGLLKLLEETVRVLQPGGVAIFETPNPQNILVSTHEFYIDPTHYTPLPSSLLKFIAEAKGLQRLKLLYLHPFPEALRIQDTGLEVAQRLNELFYGPRDYALIGWKV